MANIIDQPITNLQTSWNNYKGERVENFIKGQLSSKAACAHFDSVSNTIYFFASEEDRAEFINDETRTDLILSSTIISLSSQLYRVALSSDKPTTINSTINENSINLDIAFSVQTKSVTDAVWTSTESGVLVTTMIDAGAYGNYTIVENNKPYTANSRYSFDVRDYLVPGQNRVKIIFTSEDDSSVSNSITFVINLLEMYIESFNNSWYLPIIESTKSNYKLGGFKIVGALSKTIHLDIYQGNVKLHSFSKLLGTATYIDTPYNFTEQEGLDLTLINDIHSGVYVANVYLTSGSQEDGNLTTTSSVQYNFMYVAEGEEVSAQLICLNDIPDLVHNYSSELLYNYSVYNCGSLYSDVDLKVNFVTGNISTEKVNTTYSNVATSTKHDLRYTIEWLIDAINNLYITSEISVGENPNGSMKGNVYIPIDNSATYPATAGASLYINANTRNNSESNATEIVNEATIPTSIITPTWDNIDFAEGIDGWTTDENGRRALLIPAGSSINIPYNIFTGVENNSGGTFEICYKVANVADYDEPIITASTALTEDFNGLIIKPNQIIIHSEVDNNSDNDSRRGTHVVDEETIHFAFTIASNYNGFSGKNLVSGYLNGCKNFEFSYASASSTWRYLTTLNIGSQKSDIYIYFIRHYSGALGAAQIENNYINSLSELEDRAITRALFDSAVNSNTREIDYDLMLKSDSKYNFFVIDMISGDGKVPSNANNWAKDSTGYSNFEMHFGEHPDWDFKLYNVETTGQGTTSMNYYRWNIRFRIDKSNSEKKIPVAYYDDLAIVNDKKVFTELPSSSAKVVAFDGSGASKKHPAVRRITAKINFASSTQGHKLGATRAYNDIYKQLGLSNEAQAIDPTVTNAVYQYPAFGFQKTHTATGDTYTFIGLFTIGPDKGDKPTFGYNLGGIAENLISLEGTDHARRLALFNYPWNNYVQYLGSNECLNISGNDLLDNGWEVGNCYDLDTKADQNDIQAKLEEEFKPAYEIAYKNSTLIFPVPNDGMSYTDKLAQINADVVDFKSHQYNSRFQYGDMEFWIEGDPAYILYYFDSVENIYKPSVSLLTQLGEPVGATLDEQNEWFKARRRENFLVEAPNYWDIADSIYHFLFCLIFGATDNFAKNSYPYKMKSLSNGGRWKWRQDDLDTIFDINNSGDDTKNYYLEFEDTVNNSTIFAGSTSIFWNLLYETFWEDYMIENTKYNGIKSYGRLFINAMSDIVGGSNKYEGCLDFIKQYFWDNAQNYFPTSAYNVDCAFKYETAWTSGKSFTVEPLTQSLGNHYLGERYWVQRRIVYLMSLFNAGAFYSSSDTSLGRISFRAGVNGYTYPTFTPAYWLYPGFSYGDDSPMHGARTQEGDTYVFDGSYGATETTVYLYATNYLKKLGNLKDLTLYEGYIDPLSISGAKMEEFSIGYTDHLDDNPIVYYDGNQTLYTFASNSDLNSYLASLQTEPDLSFVGGTYTIPQTNIPSVILTNTKCLEKFYARYAQSITGGSEGSIDFSNCPRIREIWLKGTNLKSVVLKTGSKIQTLELPDSIEGLYLKSLKHLSNLILPEDLTNINKLNIENCTYQNGYRIFHDIINTPNNNLKYIRVLWEEEVPITSRELTLLSEIAANTIVDNDESGYGGLSYNNDTTRIPVIEGNLYIPGGFYRDELESLRLTDITNSQEHEGYKTAQLNAFDGTSFITYSDDREYIPFADSEVRRISANKFGNGHGVEFREARAITTIPYGTYSGANIVNFDEFQYFSNVTNLQGNGYGNGIFQNCSNLESLTLPESITSIGERTFAGCSKLAIEVYLPNLTSIANAGVFQNSGITGVRSLGRLTSIPNGTSNWAPFYYCRSLAYVNFPDTLALIGSYAFRQCSALTELTFPAALEQINDYAFWDCTSLRKITFANEPIVLSHNAFQGCYSLTDIGTPIISYLGYGAFRGCGFTTLDLSNSTFTAITGPGGSDGSNGAFASCTNLTTITLPTTCTSIGQAAFTGCSKLANVYGLENVTTIGNNAFNTCNVFPGLPLTNITSIGARAFYNCYAFGGIINAPNLTSIGNGAFRQTPITQVTSLGSITTLPGGTAGGDGVFRDCTKLTSVTLPNTLTAIGANVFAGCFALPTLSIPSSVTSFGENAFADCPALNTITINSTTPPTWGSGLCTNDAKLTTFFVPSESYELYKNATGFKNYPQLLQTIGSNKWEFAYGNTLDGYGMWDTGAVELRSNGNQNLAVTDFVELPNNCETVRFFSGMSGTQIYTNGAFHTVKFNFYGESKQYISGVSAHENNMVNLEVPEGAKYVRMCVASKNLKNFYHIWDVTNDTCLWPYRTESQE